MKEEPIPLAASLLPMLAENLFRQVFGEKKYYGTASEFNDPILFRKECRKLLRKFRKDVLALNASQQFIDCLEVQLSYIESTLKQLKLTVDERVVLILLLKFVACLLGYQHLAGPRREEPYFVPSIWAEQRGWGRSDEFYARTSVVNERRQGLVAELLEEGFTLSETAEILNISGYKVSQLNQQKRAETA